VHDAKGDKKYIICNGDEGDPGAFMDRMILESYPFRVIEGMVIAALAVGADEGYLYIRAEYPLATTQAPQIDRRMRSGRILLGDNILGSRPFAQVTCQGRRRRVRLRRGNRPHRVHRRQSAACRPSARPTPRNPVSGANRRSSTTPKRLSMMPWIIRNGAEKFAALGTEKSKGTKVFSLAGKIRQRRPHRGAHGHHDSEDRPRHRRRHRGRQRVQSHPRGRSVRRVHSRRRWATRRWTTKRLSEAGAMMGSGGMVVIDETDCIVEMCALFPILHARRILRQVLALPYRHHAAARNPRAL
jgi:NADH-quinone oxidoreductase subunit F